MNDIFIHPAFQSAIVPFFTTLLGVVILRKLGPAWSGLSIILGFYACAYLSMGFQILPLSSTRKLLVIAIVACAFAIYLDYNNFSQKLRRSMISLLVFSLLLWVMWPVLLRKEGLELMLLMLFGTSYIISLTLITDAQAKRATHVTVSLLMIGIATGVSALLGSSALLGQLGSAIAASSGAYILYTLLKQSDGCYSISLPSSILLGIIGLSSVVYASLPWYTLIPITLIPIPALFFSRRDFSPIKTVLILSLCAFPMTIIAISIAWWSAGESLY